MEVDEGQLQGMELEPRRVGASECSVLQNRPFRGPGRLGGGAQHPKAGPRARGLAVDHEKTGATKAARDVPM